jgi:hypothetical protein
MKIKNKKILYIARFILYDVVFISESVLKENQTKKIIYGFKPRFLTWFVMSILIFPFETIFYGLCQSVDQLFEAFDTDSDLYEIETSSKYQFIMNVFENKKDYIKYCREHY